MRNIKDIYESRKVREFRSKVHKSFRDGKDWVIDNKEMIIVMAPIVVGIATPIIKTVSKHITLGKAKDLKELYCYDRSLGHYWSLKRELTNNEWLTIDRRKKCGERLSDILADMRVLK